MECKFEPTDRTGLYIMVILILLNVYGCNKGELMKKLNHIEMRLNQIAEEIRR